MTKEKGNQGIVISGGTISAGQLAVGSRASNVDGSMIDPHKLTDALESVTALASVIRANGGKLPNERLALDAADALRQELKQPAPDTSRVRSFLGILAELAKEAPIIAAAVSGVAKAITILF